MFAHKDDMFCGRDLTVGRNWLTPKSEIWTSQMASPVIFMRFRPVLAVGLEVVFKNTAG